MVNVKVKYHSSSDRRRAQSDEYIKPIIPDQLPVLPLRNAVIFPYAVTSVTIGQPRSLDVIKYTIAAENLVAVVAYKDSNTDEPKPEQLYRTGCVAQVLDTKITDKGTLNVLLQGLDKIQVEDWTSEKPFLMARIEVADDLEPEAGDMEAEAVRSNLVELYTGLVSMLSYLPDDLLQSVAKTKDYRQLTYLICSSMHMDVSDAQNLLEMEDVLSKMHRITELLNHEIEVMELGKEIKEKTHGEMAKAEKDYVLRQQLKAIRKELGEEDGVQIKIEEYRKKIEAAEMSAKAKEQANLELSHLERIPESSSEYGIILNYLDWLTELPWNKETKEILDIKRARKILDEDHHGLDKIKERILEYLAVRQLRYTRYPEAVKDDGHQDQIRQLRGGVILCFVGPPGIGKTSLGQSIARALGRKLHRISLGGVHDEAEIRGHRRTYVSAMPGRFIKALRDVSCNNPVILLDEVDKLGSGRQGDPSSALLEVLDPEQNSNFRDHFLEVDFDFSHVMFIATANVLDSIPDPLRDRLEVITLSGYTDEEKLYIGQHYLLPRQRRENSLHVDELTFSDDAMLKVIQEYTREAGVRSLDRRIGSICRKTVMQIAEQKTESLSVNTENLQTLIGKQMFAYDVAERTSLPGVATGLGVTAVGGDILFVEVSGMTGKKGLTITGQLGDVMRESVEAALSYVRSQAEELGIDKNFYNNTDIHVHLPAGATPKDGPSAGVALITALVSLLTNRPVNHQVGMTGEITLRGQVLPVGGIKEKVLAANRAGLKTVILPKRNEKDLDDLPQSVLEEMNFILVEQVDKVLDNALLNKKKPG